MLRKILPLCLLIVSFGCGQRGTSEKQHTENVAAGSDWSPPPAGTVVGKIEERVTEDELNEKYFRVTLIATAQSRAGSYALKLEHGFNANETTIDLPKWPGGIVLKPVLKKGTEHYSCLIGFDTGDGAFHELYLVKVDHSGNISLKQTRGYFQA